MAVLTSFRDPGGQPGDTFTNAQGEWTLDYIINADDNRYHWILTDPSAVAVDPPDTTASLSVRVDTIETALGPTVLDCSIDLVVLLENQLV